MSISYSLSSKSNFLYPNAWLNRELHGKSYLILDAQALIRDYFVYDMDLMEWDKKTSYLVGIEGSGKTNIIRFITWVLNQVALYQKNGLVSVSTNDLRILGDHNYEYLFKGMSVINQIGDDAIGGVGTNSSEFMTSAGTDVTKKFVRSRHLGREISNPVGIVFMTFATQSFMRLNPVIRENSKLKIFTSYMDTKYFQDLFPPQEAEFIQGKYHEAHISSNWKERKYAICRTGGGGIATLEIPLVPDCQEVLDWCRKKMKPNEYINDIIRTIPITSKEEFSNLNTTKNTILQIDRSINKNIIIDIMCNYLRTHPKIQYLLKYHPDRHSLDDFSRGKLKGVLREEAKRIEDEFCVVVKKEDMISAIDQAQKEEEFAFIENREKNLKNPSIISKKKTTFTILERIKNSFIIRQEKILHLSDINEATKLKPKQISETISKNTDFLSLEDRLGRGYWCLKEDEPLDEEIEKYKNQYFEIRKKLEAKVEN